MVFWHVTDSNVKEKKKQKLICREIERDAFVSLAVVWWLRYHPTPPQIRSPPNLS